MGLLQKLKSALGLNGAGSSGSGRSGEVDVTVEREPSTEDEDAVKGTETASSGESAETAETADEDTAAGTDAADAVGTDESDESADDAAADADAADAEVADEPDDSADDEPADAVEGSTDPVTELNGIGPAYADRLSGVGIETVGELAVADAADVADEIDLGESRVAGWVEQAKAY